MDRGNTPIDQWLNRAVSGVRFGPDRAAVRAELEAHMEDKTADFQRIFPGISREEAEERALSEMGDPAEIGKELARVHKPWLGWLWRASQAALLLLLLVMTLVGDDTIIGNSNLGGWYEGESDRRAKQDGAVFLVPVEEEVAVDGCTVTVPQAVVWTDSEETELEVVLRLEDIRFWRKGGRQIELVSARDNLSGCYSSQYAWGNLGRRWERGYISVQRDGWGPFHQTYLLRINGIDPQADWIWLNYDWLGRRFSLTVDLTEEAGA